MKENKDIPTLYSDCCRMIDSGIAMDNPRLVAPMDNLYRQLLRLDHSQLKNRIPEDHFPAHVNWAMHKLFENRAKIDVERLHHYFLKTVMNEDITRYRRS